MVKTRHSGDIDDESSPKFMSLINEKIRQQQRSADPLDDGDQSGIAYRETRHAYNIFENKVVESRLRPRVGPSRAYNYLDVDSSDEEIIRSRSRHLQKREFSSERRRSRYSQSRQIKEEMLEEQRERSRRHIRRHISSHEELEQSMEDDEEDDQDDTQVRRRRRSRRGQYVDRTEDRNSEKVIGGRSSSRQRTQSVEEDQDQEESEDARVSSRSLRQHSAEEAERGSRNQSSHKHREPSEEEVEEHLIRRSLRTRRQVYDTLNQSFLVSVPGRSKNDSDEHNDHSDTKDQDSDDNQGQEFSDMYSRVKRRRVKVKPVNDDSDSDQDMRKRNKNNNKDEDDEEDAEEEENDKDGDKNRRSSRQKSLSLRKKQPQIVKSYSLREHKPRTDLYKAPIEEPRIKRMHHSIFATTPTKKGANQTYHSPAQRRNIRKRSAFHSSSSSTSSGSESSDEKGFKHRKAKSMAKARSRMMPMNFSTNALPTASVIKDRVKSGASLADVEPMNIDRNVTFNSIGGLGKHIRALKEMVVFPLLYDKVFQRFKVDPPRGVLFYGPPGTGKTLVARALANECSQGDRRVAFFMRKGADCLSKWVGESERQLRLLFDQAYKFRPSIIFFDEIDGLAPVRSSRQDQIHSSIVSTLLALMDGLDSRGEIVVIGATNRIDSLDPALRRPGRFDREFLFPLPSLEARNQILKIHTANWTPKLNDNFISELAEKCVGYCGADLKALCTEAAMLALRRRYPQIYITNEALQLDVSSINVSAKDFFDAVQNIIPTSQRAVNTPARALSARVSPLLHRQLDKVINQLSDTFPPSLSLTASLDAAVTTSQAQALADNGAIWDELASDEDEDAPSIFVPSTSTKGSKAGKRSVEDGPSNPSATPNYLNFTSYATSRPATFRPRLMLVGTKGQGQTTYIAPAVIHKMENLPVHVLDLPALYAVTAKTPEESCANVFHEAKRNCPSIVYLPYVNQWWDVMADTLRATLLTLIQDLDPTLPLLLLATSEQHYHTLDPVLQSLFSQISGEVICMADPNTEERRSFFKDLLLRQACRPPPQKKQAGEILKLLRDSKREPYSRSLTKLRKLRQQNRHEISSLPSYIYPFGSDNEVDMAYCTEQNSDYRKDKTKKTMNMPHHSFSELSNTKLRFSQKVRSKLSQVAVKMTHKPVCIQPPVKSKHAMILRSRSNALQKLNSNQSARDVSPLLDSSAHHSRRPTILSYSKGVSFKKPVLPAVKDVLDPLKSRHCLRHGKKSFGSHNRSKPSKSKRNCRDFQKSHEKKKDDHPIANVFCNVLTSRHERYLRHLHRLETKIGEAGPSHKANHGSLSSHHMCYLRQLRKLSAVLGHSSCCNSVAPLSSCLPMKMKPSSVLSCGSFQMLYKNGHDSRKYNSELALPLNLCDLPSRIFRCQSRTHEGMFKREGFCAQSRYNLRPRKYENPAQRMLEVLPKAAPPKPRELTNEELKLLVEKEELTLMELRIFLRDVLNKLGSDKKFSIFAKPVNIEDAPDYYEIIEQPMDLSTMMAKIDLHEYSTVRSFMKDIDLICSNALEYNPNRGPMDRVIRHRACALKDTAYAIIKTELDKDFEKTCVEIEESRKRRGEKSSTVPNFYYTQPNNQAQQSNVKSQAIIPSYLENPKPVRSIPKPEGERFSRRVRGLNSDPVPPLETVEKLYKGARLGLSPCKDNKNNSNESSGTATPQNESVTTHCEKKEVANNSASSPTNPQPASPLKEEKSGEKTKGRISEETKSQPFLTCSSGSKKRKLSKCVWCKPRRKRPKNMNTTRQLAGLTSGEEGVDGTVSHEEGEEEGEEESTPLESQKDQQALLADVTESEVESRDQRSPTRASTRHKGSSRVSTHRSSMSPSNCGLASHPSPSSSHNHCSTDPPESSRVSEALQIQQTAPATEKEETMEITEPAESEGKQTETMKHQSSPPIAPDKPKVVKRLDLESVTVDSGVGSSVDSNGDSRDSMDHRGEGDSSLRSQPSILAIHDTNQNCSAELKNRANAILHEPSQKVVVDVNRLTSLLNRLVARTDGYNVERLEKIYSHLSQIIYRHRHSYNKTGMVSDLEKKVDDMTKIIPSSSSSSGGYH